MPQTGVASEYGKPVGLSPALWVMLCGLLYAAVACAGPADSRPALRVVGASDVRPLAEAFQRELSVTTGISITVLSSVTSVADLKAGRADVAFLGREPTREELEGLRDIVVAYDAIFIVVDTRSYVGGINMDSTRNPVEFKTRTSGLKSLRLDELRALYGNPLRGLDDQWRWRGGYWEFQAETSSATGAVIENPNLPGYPLGTWVDKPVALRYELTQPGKFDTQRALYDSLGLDERKLSRERVAFLPPYYDSEEELVSRSYQLDEEQQREGVANRPFPFSVSALSRRVVLKAIAHGFALRVVAVDGIDPSQDTSSIYSGTYPLSRRIHVLTREPPSPDATAFVWALLSDAGQNLIEKYGLLPLPGGLAYVN